MRPERLTRERERNQERKLGRGIWKKKLSPNEYPKAEESVDE